MATRLKLRNVATVGALFEPKEKEEANDIHSDEEEDNVEKLTDSESEQDPLDSYFEEPNEDQPETDSEDEERERSSKRRKKIRGEGEFSEREGEPVSILGSDGYEWSSSAPSVPKTSQSPSSTFLPGPIGEARDTKSPLEAWSLLLDDALLSSIVNHTNEEIERYRNSLESRTTSDHIYADVTLTELKAFVGLLYFSGLQRTSKTGIDELWSNDYGSIMYRATMPKRRFQFIARMTRFDEKLTRRERRESDKFAPIRECWEAFVSNCTNRYSPSFNCTIDRQLLPFRGRCPFRVYGGRKGIEDGVKLVTLVDSATFYMHRAEPYVGKVPKEGGASYYVRKLSEGLRGTARNLSCDGWFASVELFETILEERSLTMVGTLRKNKPQIPEYFRKPGNVLSSRFAFDETKTLVSHTPRRNEILVLLSTLHHDSAIDSETRKPEILKFYEAAKNSSETFDRMSREFTTARKTLRWTMRIFMGMLDQASINAMVLYNFNVNNKELLRRSFIKLLIRELVDPHLTNRLKTLHLRRNLRLMIEDILGVQPATILPNTTSNKSARCNFCPRSQDRKTRVHCATCRRTVCEDHRTIQCINCLAHD